MKIVIPEKMNEILDSAIAAYRSRIAPSLESLCGKVSSHMQPLIEKVKIMYEIYSPSKRKDLLQKSKDAGVFYALKELEDNGTSYERVVDEIKAGLVYGEQIKIKKADEKRIENLLNLIREIDTKELMTVVHNTDSKYTPKKDRDYHFRESAAA